MICNTRNAARGYAAATDPVSMARTGVNPSTPRHECRGLFGVNLGGDGISQQSEAIL
ncbi:MAG: hypothetical protein MUQ00_15705 [Candidatus Aminicenantes bacterium]|nr:hypothetical protein [Candidatus Aminicenantes bacterium]